MVLSGSMNLIDFIIMLINQNVYGQQSGLEQAALIEKKWSIILKVN